MNAPFFFAPESTAQRHAAAPLNGKARPIAYPNRAEVDALSRQRANADNERWQAQVERRDALVAAATKAGREAGERAGYTAGWHWGLACGACLGGVAVALLWLGWAHLQQILDLAAGWLLP